MQQVFSHEIKQHCPEVEVTIACPFPELDNTYYSSVKIIRSRRRNLPLATFHWLLLETLRLLGFTPSRYPLGEEVNAMIHADAIIDLSGDMLTEDYGSLVGYSHFLPLLQAQALKRPVIICAQSIGPFRKLATLAKLVLSRSHLITVRESITPDLLATLNEPAINTWKTADLAFMLQPSSSEHVDSVLDKEGITLTSRPLLGVSVSALLANKANRHLAASDKDKLTVFARALDAITDDLDIDVLLVPHVFGPRASGDDRLICQKLSERMRHTPHQLRGEYRPEEIKGVITRCDAFIGCRMHANIAALDSHIPVLAIGYSHKTRGILADLGLDEWVLSIDTLNEEQLFNAIHRLFAEANTYKQKLTLTLPDIRKRSRDNIQAIANLIRQNSREASP